MSDPKRPPGSAPPHSASHPTGPPTPDPSPVPSRPLQSSFQKNIPITTNNFTVPIFDRDYAYQSNGWQTWTPQALATYLGVDLNTSKPEKPMFKLPLGDFWARRTPLNHEPGLPASVRKHITNQDDRIINQLNKLYQHVFPVIQTKWPRLPYFLQVYAARWLCKSREEDILYFITHNRPRPVFDDSKTIMPSYSQLFTKFNADPFLRDVHQGNQLNTALQTPPIFFDRMQLTQQSYPIQLPAYFNSPYKNTYPLECRVAIPVEVNNIIFTVWHTSIFSTDANCLAVAITDHRLSSGRTLEVTQAHMRTTDNLLINTAVPNSSDILCITAKIVKRTSKPLAGAGTRMALYLSTEWPDKDTLWQFYLMYTFNIQKGQKHPLYLSVTSSKQAKQLELLIAAVRDTAATVPTLVISFLLDAVELSNDVIMCLILQNYVGLLPIEARWRHVEYLLPNRKREDPRPIAVLASIPVDHEGSIMFRCAFPPFSQASLRYVLTQLKFDERVIDALVEPSILHLVIEWTEAYRQQQQRKHSRPQLILPNTTTAVVTSRQEDHSTSPMPPTLSQPVPDVSFTDAFPSSHPPVPTPVIPTQPHENTVPTDSHSDEPLALMQDESIHEETRSPDSNVLHKRSSSPQTPPVPPLSPSTEPIPIQHPPKRRQYVPLDYNTAVEVNRTSLQLHEVKTKLSRKRHALHIDEAEARHLEDKLEMYEDKFGPLPVAKPKSKTRN